jgi:hypothetical protein
MNRNAKRLASFVAFCEAHPDLRFWQALLNWANVNFIYVSSCPSMNISPNAEIELRDTFYWEGENS